jgi:hypothetical protein
MDPGPAERPQRADRFSTASRQITLAPAPASPTIERLQNAACGHIDADQGGLPALRAPPRARRTPEGISCRAWRDRPCRGAHLGARKPRSEAKPQGRWRGYVTNVTLCAEVGARPRAWNLGGCFGVGAQAPGHLNVWRPEEPEGLGEGCMLPGAGVANLRFSVQLGMCTRCELTVAVSVAGF